MSDRLHTALAALDDCAEALAELDAGCCEPGRSPRMRALGKTLSAARDGVAVVDAKPAAAVAAIAALEDAGAQVGRLQVTCCAPSRLPLYARILEGLTKAQITVSRTAGLGH